MSAQSHPEHELPSTPEAGLALFDIPETVPPFEYELLTGHMRTNGSFKNDEQLRSEYVHLTDDLIHQMTDGVSVVDPISRERVLRKPDIVIWLDKSARPVSWLAKELWPIMALDSEGNLPPMPAYRFVNIDREQWVNQIDPEGIGLLDINKVDQTIVRSLRSIFMDPKDKADGLTEKIDTASSLLDGKTILIVDEVMASGRTLDIARKFFSRAFPKTAIATTHWMKGVSMIGTAQGNADLPVWYKERDIKGRGVGNRDERVSQDSHSRTQRLGSWFLSTSLPESDPASLQLRTELHQLAEDVKDKKVLVIPSLDRDIDDIIERTSRLNGMTFQQFKVAKEKLFAQTRVSPIRR